MSQPTSAIINSRTNSRRVSIAELARYSSVGASSSGHMSAGHGVQRLAMVSRRVSRLIGEQRSLRGSAICEETQAEDFMSKARARELPAAPRFAASLSPEAQYATFKCYEGLARRAVMSAGCAKPHQIARTPTPMEMLRNRFELAAANQHKRPPTLRDDASPSSVEAGGVSRDTSRSQSRVSVGRQQQLQQLQRQQQNEDDIPLPGQQLTAYLPSLATTTASRQRQHRVVQGGVEDSNEASNSARLQQQIKQSFRLENVMEIIDFLRNRNGGVVTNRRFTRHDIQPLEHYHMWMRLWNKEFVVLPRLQGEEGAIKTFRGD